MGIQNAFAARAQKMGPGYQAANWATHGDDAMAYIRYFSPKYFVGGTLLGVVRTACTGL